MNGNSGRPDSARRPSRGSRSARPQCERMESRHLLSDGVAPVTIDEPAIDPAPVEVQLQSTSAPPISASQVPLLTQDDVAELLRRAAAASASDDAIIAIVDRGGAILGVRVESGVSPNLTGDPSQFVFAVDGAVAKARTGAFFGNDQAPLTSRTIQIISQSTMVERVIESNPNVADPESPEYGPGFVAPVGIKGHFPPNISFTPQVDLFLIEHTNRVTLTADPAFIPPGVSLPVTQSYGAASGLLETAMPRGIATLPGGVPIVKGGKVVGGIGVFFPGETGFATEENSNLNDPAFRDRRLPDRSLEAEFIAFRAVGGSRTAGVPFGPAPFGTTEGFTLPFGRIDLVGITLDLFGGHGNEGIKNLLMFGRRLGVGDPNDGVNVPVTPGGETLLAGRPFAEGWLVEPHAGGGLTAEDVIAIVEAGVKEANIVRAAIRLPLDSSARMIFSVTDLDGNILGLFRMPDATIFSIDVAVAKARNVAYYADPTALQDVDKLPGIPRGTAFTNRTFRYLTLPFFPEGINGYPPGPFSILNDPGIARNGATITALPASAYTSIQAHDAFNPQSNFHDPDNPENQNGIVFFPGSAALYKDLDGDGIRDLVGGLGVSGDGVDQDDDVTFMAARRFNPPFTIKRVDQLKTFRNVRLPYQKFNRQPHNPFNQPKLPAIIPSVPLPTGRHRRRP